jgi:hypothetical protein
VIPELGIEAEAISKPVLEAYTKVGSVVTLAVSETHRVAPGHEWADPIQSSEMV